MALQPGALTDAIEAAFAREWQKVKTVPLPAAGGPDRRMMFAAVAHGLLDYLEAHQNEVLKSIKARDEAGQDRTFEISEADLDIDTGS